MAAEHQKYMGVWIETIRSLLDERKSAQRAVTTFRYKLFVTRARCSELCGNGQKAIKLLGDDVICMYVSADGRWR